MEPKKALHKNTEQITQKERIIRESARRERARRRRIARRIKIAGRFVVMTVMVGIIIKCAGLLFTLQTSGKSKDDGKTYAYGLEAGAMSGDNDRSTAAGSIFAEVDTDCVLKDTEVEEKLRELATENTDIAAIFAERNKYPEEMLRTLSLNQETLGFVQGYLLSDGSVTGGFNEDEKEQDFPLLLQWDARWGYAPYGESNIGISGCGPTCLSMVIYALTRNESATPDKLAEYSMEKGHYVRGHGTAWTLMTEAPAVYGVTAGELGLDEDGMKRALDCGQPIICGMRPGDFTTEGHFIVLYGYDEEGFFVNDPNSRERSNKHWTYEKIKNQIKIMWTYSKI